MQNFLYCDNFIKLQCLHIYKERKREKIQFLRNFIYIYIYTLNSDISILQIQIIKKNILNIIL